AVCLDALDIEPPDDFIRAVTSNVQYSGRYNIDVTGAALQVLEATLRNPRRVTQQEALIAAIAQLRNRHQHLACQEPPVNVRRLNRPLGAIAVILRSERGFVDSLRPQQCTTLLDISKGTLDAIAAIQANPDALDTLSPDGRKRYLDEILYTFRN